MTVAEPKVSKRKKSGYSPVLLISLYKMAKSGMIDQEIYQALSISKKTFWLWCKKWPEIIESLAIARRDRQDSGTLVDWIYSKLSPDVREVWDKIKKVEKDRDGISQIETIFADYGESTRQKLFLYALCIYNFSPSKAMAKVNLSKKKLDKWLTEDIGFAELVEEIEWHKKNFFEDNLVSLVKDRNPAVVMFANRTVNSDRGYGVKDKLEVNHSGAIMHGVMDLTEIAPYLSDVCRAEIMAALRKLEESKDSKPLTTTDFLSAQIANIPESITEYGLKEIPTVTTKEKENGNS